jgi:hypothetical protein
MKGHGSAPASMGRQSMAALLAFLLLIWSPVAPRAALAADAAPLQASNGAVSTNPDKIMDTIPEAQKYWQNCYNEKIKNGECNRVVAASMCKGEVIQQSHNISRIGQIMDYNVNAAYAAACLDQADKYFDMLMKSARLALKAGVMDMAALILLTVVEQLIDAVLEAIMNSLANAVCQITNEVIGAIDSAIRNAICLPSASLGNPLDFHLDLGRMQCSGWSIDALSGDIYGSPVQGVSMPLYNSGTNPSPTLHQDVAPMNTGPLTLDPIIVPPATAGKQ